ncbi:uncharacterized protein LOC131301383 [Rhododendron vialii]|uniref:uncharacterized protein LOC131301383 n=1 Tax=Rhododendron vialii TaxID=182163 RepID=UPI00265EFA95|nr:uncharacterized protein LOC131301383 [Rhododendron vialii]
MTTKTKKKATKLKTNISLFSVIVSVIYQIKPSGGGGDGSYLDVEDSGTFSREQEEARGGQEWTLELGRGSAGSDPSPLDPPPPTATPFSRSAVTPPSFIGMKKQDYVASTDTLPPTEFFKKPKGEQMIAISTFFNF